MEQIILDAWENRELLKEKTTVEAIEKVIAQVDAGELRVANQDSNGEWKTNEWVKKAIILYFPLRKMEKMEAGIF